MKTRFGFFKSGFPGGITAAVLFLAVLVLTGLPGCGDDTNPTDTTGDVLADTADDIPTSDTSSDVDAGTGGEGKVIHVDLTGLPPHETAYLHVAGKTYELVGHDDDSRDEAKEDNELLQTVADEDLTHYATDVELPDDRVALMWVTHTPHDDKVGEHGFGLVGIHIPEKSMTMARTLRASQGWPKYKKYLADPMPKRDLDKGRLTRLASDPNDDPDEFVTPLDAAKAIIFHHPELTSLDPDIAALVMTHIENSTGLIELAESISFQGPAYEHDDAYPDGWAVLEPILDEEGHRRLKDDGSSFYHYILSEQTKTDAELAVRNVLRAAHDDRALEGTTWHVQDGVGSVDATPPAADAAVPRAAGGYTWTLDHTQTRAGLLFSVEGLENNSTTGLRQIKVSLKNYWLRHLTFFVGFERLDGTKVDIPVSIATSQDDKTNKFLHVGNVAPVVTIMGIPLSADWTTFTVQIPDDAQKVILLSGGLGTGYLDFGHVANNGIIMTSVFEYGIPLFFLAAGAGIQSTSWFKSIMEDKELVLAIIVVGGFLLAGENAGEIALTGNAKAVLSRTATLVGGLILSQACKALAAYLTEKLTEAELEGAIPFVGWAIQVLNISATLASLAQTTAEVASSPWVIKNAVAPSMNMKVKINRDPDDYQFPATATKYKLIATYNDATHRELPKEGFLTMPLTTVSDPIYETFENVPAGGSVEVTVAFYSNTDYLVGRGSTGRVSNVIGSGDTELNVEMTIEELKVPLTETTTYNHKQSLNYIGGQYEWVAGDAPEETIADLSCNNVGSHLCSLDNITFSQKTGMFGYAWQAAGPNMTLCDTSTGDLQLHYVQNMSAKSDPNLGYKSLECGMSTQPTIIYDLMGAADGTGFNFFLDTRDGSYHLRRVTLDETTPMTYSGQSWGRFTQPLDDIAMREGGYLVGANWANSKIEILKVPDHGFPDNEAPWAQLLGGQGTREGLLYGPKAIAFTADGTLLILESLNKRIQALDVDGNPVKYFAGGTEYFAALHDEATLVNYLDMGVEYMGYIYVLSYINSGATANDYRLDIYSPDGSFLTRTTGFAAHKMAVDFWRNVYSLNYQQIVGPGGRTEPSVSEWIPSTPVAE